MALIGHNTVYLLPNADVGVNNFQLSAGSDFFDLVDDWSSGTYIYRTNGLNRSFDFTYSDMSVWEASETDITIESVGFEIYARSTSTGTKTDTVTLEMKIQNGDASTTYYTESETWQVGQGPHTLKGTVRPTTNGSTLWTFSTLNNLRLRGEWTANAGSGDETIYVYTIAYNVRYTYTPQPVTYTSDDNVILKNGLTELKNGLTII